MKALRRSIKGDKESKPNISIQPKSKIAIIPPIKVIRALYDYQAQSSQELSFSRGDFFHVIGRENDMEWYQACNPAVPDALGLVPVSYFQALGKNGKESFNEKDSPPFDPPAVTPVKNPDHDSGYADYNFPGSPPAPFTIRSSRASKPGSMIYGIVIYDFIAERSDELEAKAGEAIIVIAQSNPEWFVAKPIGRLGGPGLIPSSFVEIRDMATNTPVLNSQEAIRRAGVPRVEEWKEMASNYKNSSITLGKLVTNQADPPQELPSPQEDELLLQQSSPPPSSQQPEQPYQRQQAPRQQVGRQRSSSQIRQRSLSQMSRERREYMRQDHPHGSMHSGAPRANSMQAHGPRTSRQHSFSSGKRSHASGGHESKPSTPQMMASPVSMSDPFSPREVPDSLPAPISARIVRFYYNDDKYWFVVEAVMDNGRVYELSKYYEDFYDFQIALLSEFPFEAGNTGTQRILPFMPGPVSYVTEPITAGRQKNLNIYLEDLLALPEHISKSALIRRFFAPGPGDTEIDINQNDPDRTYRSSGGSGASRPSLESPVAEPSFPSSSQQNPNDAPFASQSALIQPAHAHNPAATSPAAAIMKVKLSYNGDYIAIRVPQDVQFEDLCTRIRERLRIPPDEPFRLSYRDEPTGDKVGMVSNRDLHVALSRNEKMLLFVE